MNHDAVVEYLEHFQRRVVQDALIEAEAEHWRRRADTFEWARPRPTDYTGQATSESLRALDTRCRVRADACRQRARVALIDDWGNVA